MPSHIVGSLQILQTTSKHPVTSCQVFALAKKELLTTSTHLLGRAASTLGRAPVEANTMVVRAALAVLVIFYVFVYLRVSSRCGFSGRCTVEGGPPVRGFGGRG